MARTFEPSWPLHHSRAITLPASVDTLSNRVGPNCMHTPDARATYYSKNTYDDCVRTKPLELRGSRIITHALAYLTWTS
jgi:hypothetical protein